MTISITWIGVFAEGAVNQYLKCLALTQLSGTISDKTIWSYGYLINCYSQSQHRLDPSSPSLRCLCVLLDLLLGFVTDATNVCCSPKPLLQINISSFLERKRRVMLPPRDINEKLGQTWYGFEKLNDGSAELLLPCPWMDFCCCQFGGLKMFIPVITWWLWVWLKGH